MKVLEFRNDFRLFSYILTEEEKYQIHDDSSNYVPKVHVHIDNTSYTTEPVDSNCTVERHGTASYLLGNSGQHAYNGNPPKRRRDSDTPSTSMDEEIKHLHYTMINELNDHLSSKIETEWKKFTGVLPMYLGPADIAGATTMFEVCNMLKTRRKIRYGKYDKLQKVFSIIKNQTCIEIVDKYSTKMEEDETQPHRTQQDGMALYMEWKKQDKLCYETKGVKAVKEKICNQSCVCVFGVPGSGKFTAIRHAALHLQETLQYTIYLIEKPNEFKKYFDKDKKQVFVILLRTYFVNTEKLGLWDDMIKSCLQVSKHTKFLTSLRLQVHSDELLEEETYIFNDKDNQVNLGDKDFKLSLDDMKNMLQHNLEVRNEGTIEDVGNMKALIEGICGEWWWGKYMAAKSADYFPLLCKVFSSNASIRENPEKFFTEPFPALIDIFKQIKSKNKHQFCGLLLCAFMELKHGYFSPHYPYEKPKIFTSLIESQNLHPKQDLADIKNALKVVEGVYISQNANNNYVFLHSTFRDITAFLYKDEYAIFQYATRDFIQSRVRLFSKSSEDDNYVLVFHGDDCIELLVNRMIHELKCQTEGEGAGFIVCNRYIDDDRVVGSLCTKLFESQDTDLTQDMVDSLFGRCMMAVWMYCVQHRDNRDETTWPGYKLLVRLISRVDCTRPMDALSGTYPIFQCIETGSMSLTKLVVQQSSEVINATDVFTNHSVLHAALKCVNNVEMTRYLLSLPNFTRLNHRDKDNRTPYWYVEHCKHSWCIGSGSVRVIANVQDMMDSYKQAGAFALGDDDDNNDKFTKLYSSESQRQRQ